MTKVGVVVFPGSNCDHDVLHTFERVLGQDAVTLWHGEEGLKACDVLVIPGGFSYGDYLRTGALAKLSPVMKKVREFAESGGPVLGICNGFQILCEAGLLPGALLQNRGMQFLSRFVHMKVESTATPFTAECDEGEVVTCPIAHFDGNYFADPAVIEELEAEKRVVFRYCDRNGAVTEETNPNGSVNGIAGICNERRNVVGLMPHPERSVESIVGYLGGESGQNIFRSVLKRSNIA